MAGKSKKKESPLVSAPQTSVRMSPKQIEDMLIHVLRLPNLFNIAKAQMPISIFDPKTEIVYRKLWAAALTVEKDIGSEFFHVPRRAKHSLWSVLEPQLASDNAVPFAVKDYLLNTNNGLLQKTFDYDNLQATDAHAMLKRFMRERLVQIPLWKKLSSAEGNLLIDLPDILREAQHLDVSLAATDADPVESGAPEGWQPANIGKFPTGVAFIDEAMRGGQAPGEVYGILGAYSSGKTSLAVQVLYCSARYQQHLADTLNVAEPEVKHYPKECYIFTYEATSDEIRMRLWSSAFSIHHEHLEELDRAKLSSVKNGLDSLHEYEKKLFEGWKKAGLESCMQGELERLDSGLPILRRNIWVLDMSGTGDNPKQGTGYVPEIRRIIEADLERKERKSGRKHEVGVIVIDYAGLAASRYMGEQNISDEHRRHYVGGFGMECKKELAVPLQCPVWVFHQMTGDANKRTNRQTAHYTDAAEAKNFAENMAFCFALGTKDTDTNLLLFTCSKARRARILEPQPLIIEGEFFRLAANKEMGYDKKTKTYYRKTSLKGDQVSAVDNSSLTIKLPTKKEEPDPAALFYEAK